MSKIRQSEFMQIHGIFPTQIREIRDNHLLPSEWWKEGTTIYWDSAAADRVAIALNQPSPTPTDEQDEEGQPGIQEPDPAQVPMPEVPIGTDSFTDTQSFGSGPEIAGPAETQAEAPLTWSESSRQFPDAPVESSPSESPSILSVRVLKRARNYRFVYANCNGERISVMCPKKGRKNIVGKTIQVSCETIDGQTQYTMIP